MGDRRQLSRREVLAWPVAFAGTAAFAAPPAKGVMFTPGLFRAMTDAMLPALGQRRGAVALAELSGETLRFAFNHAALAETLAKPGSTVKPFVLHHLLETGSLRATSEHLCRRRLRFAGRNLDCSHAPQPNPLRGEEALALSCKEFFLDAGQRMAPGEVAGVLRNAGIDQRTPFHVRCAAANVRTPSNSINAALQAIGEAEVLVTPLSLLYAYQRLLVRLLEAPRTEAKRLVLAGMEGCVRYGTGADAALKGVAIGGKTGTSTSPERQRLDGWFLSYAPARRPRYAMVVFVENGHGGTEAAPVARAIWSTLHAGGVLS